MVLDQEQPRVVQGFVPEKVELERARCLIRSGCLSQCGFFEEISTWSVVGRDEQCSAERFGLKRPNRQGGDL